MAQLTEKARQRLTDPNFGYLATIMEDGSPQVSPVWVDVEGDQIIFNTAKGRVKEQNLRRDPRVAISIGDKDNQYDKVDIRGRSWTGSRATRRFPHRQAGQEVHG